MDEAQAILKIVCRNLNLTNWQNLETEAQSQMIQEVELLLHDKNLSLLDKQKLQEGIDRLKTHFTISQLEKNDEIMETYNSEMGQLISNNSNINYCYEGILLRSTT
ncbi:MAG: hypothetical protein BRC37_04440 [Cyanobacteria bacterium QH_3_48_40]|nr:MAG: hypothetical protein BRC37_04440 [Cyanobacteria bacterium QH_3_48_40]